MVFHWDETQRTAAIEAGTAVMLQHQCNRCHKIDELPAAARADDCVSCHVFLKGLTPDQELYQRIAAGNGKDVLDRYIAKIDHYMELPDLTGLAKRVRTDWIGGFLENPHDMRPLLEESMIRNKLSADDIKNVVRYFAAIASSADPYHESYQKPKRIEVSDQASLDRGKQLFSERGCTGCHTFGSVDFGIPAETLMALKPLALLAPNLRYTRDRLRPDVLVDWILDPAKVKPGTKMPQIVTDREEATLIAGYLMNGDVGVLKQPTPASKLMELPPAVDREVGWAEVKEEVLGFVCVHCHMNDHEKDTGPGNKGGLGYVGIGLSFRTYESAVYGAIDPKTQERYSVLVPREGESVSPVLDAMARRRVENARDTVAPFQDVTQVPFGEGRLGMPLGLPAMSDEQFGILRAWIEQGCPGPTQVTGQPDKDDGFLVPDGPIENNRGCELRAPADKAPAWSTRAQPKKEPAPEKPKNEMLRRVADAIGLREGEEARTGRLFFFIFALTIAFVLAKTAQQGIFLGAYSRDRIPDAFIISALLLAATSFLSSALAPRLGPVRLLSWLLLLSTGGFVIARFSMAHVYGGPMALYALVEAAIGLLLIQAWTVVTEVLDVRAAKRLLPLVGNAASIGWAVGGFATRPLTHALGAPGLLLASAGLLLLCFGMNQWILVADLQGRAARGRKGVGLWAGARAGVGAVARVPLLRVLALITVSGLLIEQLLDYQFFAAAQLRFDGDSNRIAAFMGTFFGVTGLIGIGIQLVLSGRVLTLLGSSKSSLAAPGIALIASLIFIVSPGFAIIVGARGAYRVLKQALSSSARAQIQGVLPSVQRAQSGALLKGVLAPLFYALGGAALKLVAPDTDLRWMSGAAVIIAAISVGATALWLSRAYVGALRRSVDRRRLDLGAVNSENQLAPEHYQLLAEELDDPEERAELAVSILAGGEPRLARPLLRRALDHDSAVVRIGAIEALGHMGEAADVPLLVRALEGTDDENVQRAALTSLVAIGGPEVGRVLAEYVEAEQLHIRALARAHMVVAGDAARMHSSGVTAGDAKSAANSLRQMVEADDAREREAAAWAMVHVAVKEPSVRAAFRGLLDDPDPAVRCRAVAAAGHLGDRALVGSFVHALGDPVTASAAFAAFEAAGDELTDEIEVALEGASVLVYSRAAAALAAGDGPHGETLLRRLLIHDNRVVRYRAARALTVRLRRRSKLLPPGDEVREALRREVAIGYGYYALLIGIARTDGVVDFEIEPEFEIIATEIRVRIRQTEQRIFSLLALVADSKIVRTAELSLRGDDARRAARALELLEHIVDPTLARSVSPLLERRPLRMRHKDLSDDLPIPPGYLADPLAGIMEMQDPHLVDCAITCYRDKLSERYPEAHARAETVIPLVQRLHFLRRVPLFAGLSGEDLMQVARIASPLSLPENRIIFHKGDPGDVMYLIMRGTVSVRDGERELATIGPDEFFGELAVLDHEPRSATVVCIEDTDLLTIAQADLDELMERRSEIAREVIQVLTRRLREATKRIS